jgi:lysophospholipase L1-like esterase
MRRIVSTLVLVGMMLGSMLWVSQARSEAGAETLTFLMPTFAVAPDGQLWAAWVADTGDDWEIAASRWDGQAWAPAEIVAPQPDRWDASPSLAFDVNGVAWLAWASSTGVDDTLHLSHWTGYGWSAPEEVPVQETMPSRQPALAQDPDGGLWLAWVGFDGNDDEIYAAHWDGSAWSEPQRISGDDVDPAAYDTQPRLAVGSDGDVWVAWTGHEKFLDTEIFVAHWEGQRWLGEQQVSPDDDTVDASPSLAVARDGTVWLAWHGRTAKALDAGSRIHATHWNQSDGWDSEAIVSSPLSSAVAEERPSLALDANGRPHLIWHVDDGELGMGYATYDGDHWSSPRWPVQDAVTEGACLIADNVPWTVWLPEVGDAHLPFEQRILEGDEAALPVFEAPARPLDPADIVINRHVAFGDSITLGAYNDPDTGEPVGAYPPRLEGRLDTRVVESQVLNLGVSGERTLWGLRRLEWDVLPTYEPEFVEIMEGTNDITADKPYDDIASNLWWMIKHCKKADTRALLATVIPRLDSLNDETATLNGYIVQVAADHNVPLVDNWGAFYAVGDLPSLYADHLHPNTPGMIVLATSWYNGIVNGIPWLNEEIVPPTTWISALPAQTECGQMSTVVWTGTDNLSWVVSYDVQVQANYGPWIDWHMATQNTSAPYVGNIPGTVFGFRVRGRDVVGNESVYSAARYTTFVDQEPPTTWIESLPAQTACGQLGTVTWTGTDNSGWVVDYDVQVQTDYGPWIDWHMATQNTSASYVGNMHGTVFGFRVRGRDVVGNESVYSAARYTTIVDQDPPYGVWISSLRPVQKPPFEIRWLSADACSQVSRYEVEVRVGPAGDWTLWQIGTHTSALFGDDEPVEYGQIYYFRVRAYDAAGNWAESDLVSTTLAQFTLSGSVFNARHEPVAHAQAGTDPAALITGHQPGGYFAHLVQGGIYSLLVQHNDFGLLPARHGISVSSDVSGLDFVLPPLDDTIGDGGFETANWDQYWQAGGTFTPTLISEAHTGIGAVLMGGDGELSQLSQTFSVPDTLINATLSFLVRLDEEAGESSTLQVELSGTPISHTQNVSVADWTHVWVPVDAAVGQAVTLTFTLSDTAAVRIDEVSLGSAVGGGYLFYLPIVNRTSVP